MQFFALILLSCFFLFLFLIYALSYDDLVFLKKDVSLERVFNFSVAAALISFFFSRLLYGILYSQNIFVNPLKFLVFPYYPGLSLTGAVIGWVVFLFIFRRENLPSNRLFDFFSISFLGVLPIGYLGYFLLAQVKILSLIPVFSIVIYSLLFIFFIFYLLQCLLKRKVEDGTVGFLFLVAFSLISLIKIYLEKRSVFSHAEDFILLLILLISLVLIVDKEKIVEKIKRS